jgi:uncharacterized protein YcnI
VAVRIAAVAVVSAALMAWGVASAAAHVAVSPESAPRGSTAELTFRVPNEESQAVTTKIQLQIPTSTPIAQVLVRPTPGWTATTHSTKLTQPLVTDDGKFTTVVDEVSWSGGRIEPGQYQDFALSADPLPDQGSQVVFKTIQTYSNGDVVRWIDVAQPGQPEPEHPAPVLVLTSDVGPDMAMGTPTAVASTSSTSGWPGVVAVIALVLALASACGVAVLMARTRSTS